MHITIFGTGYVGLVQAVVLAEVGHEVVSVDINERKVNLLRQGKVPIFEPGLERLLTDNLAAGRLQFTTSAAQAIEHGRIIFIAVGTPPDEDGSADIRHVLDAAKSIGAHMNAQTIVVNKSTVPVGTADKVRAAIAAQLENRGRTDIPFDVASNPEFLKEGSAVADIMKPDRILLGVSERGADTENLLREIYAPFNRNHEKIIVMDVRSAELAKYAANCMLATKISFMNEMANLAERLGADIEKVRLGIGADPRIGYHFIYPGAGYGGSCFPKDVRALIRMAHDSAFQPLLVEAVEQRNERQKHLLFEKITEHFKGDLAGRTFALWGLSFKPNTDDMREAPSRAVMEALWQAGSLVRAYDPKAMDECRRIYGDRPDLFLASSQNDALQGADALILVTEWKNFHAPDFQEIATALKESVIFDGRNIYDPSIVRRYGLTLRAIGRRG